MTCFSTTPVLTIIEIGLAGAGALFLVIASASAAFAVGDWLNGKRGR